MLIESRASSRYNALQLKFQQRAGQRSSVLAAYTLGKSTDDASGCFTSTGDPNFPQNSLDPEAERGRSSFNVRHRFSFSFAYELPFAGNWPTQAQDELVAFRDPDRGRWGYRRTTSSSTSAPRPPGHIDIGWRLA